MCCSKQRQRTYGATGYHKNRGLRRTLPNQIRFQDLSLTHQADTSRPRWTEYQPRTMAGMIVMSLAMGVHEGVKKIQDKKEERKAKKAALVRSRVEIEYLCSLFIVSDINAIVANPTHGGSSVAGSAQGLPPTSSRNMRKSGEIRLDQESHRRRSSSSERINDEDVPPSYEASTRPMYEEAMQHTGRRP
jgi:hypothetical protein